VRALLISESSIKSVLIPKSSEEIKSSDLSTARGEDLIKFGFKLKDLEFIKSGIKKLESNRYAAAGEFYFNFDRYLHRISPEIKDFMVNYLENSQYVSGENILKSGFVLNNYDLIKRGFYKLKGTGWKGSTYIPRDLDYSKLNHENRLFVYERLLEIGNEKELLKFGLSTNDYDLIKKYRSKFFPELKKVHAEDLKSYMSKGFKSISLKRGYKLYRILEYVYNNQPVRYTDMIRYAYEFSHGKGTYNNEVRGYYSTAFSSPPRWGGGSKGYSHYFNQDKTNGWSLSPAGLRKLQELKSELSQKLPNLF
jgi:hypothetical protein